MARKPAARLPEGYDPGVYPRVAVTVDVVVLTLRERRLQVLLVERGSEPWLGAWALPGGFIQPSETLEEAAARELREETGVDASAYLEQLGAYGDPDRDPRLRVVSVAFLAVSPRLGPIAAGTDAARAELVPVDEILGPAPRRTLAFDHETILSDAIARAREKLSSTSLATVFVGPEFTLGELREVYETAWGVELDPGNFRRKVLSTQNFVVATGRYAAPGPEGGKPAEIYRPFGRARLHPPLQPPSVEAASGAAAFRGAGEPAEPDLDRAAVWCFWLGEDPALQRHLIAAGIVAPVAHGERVISDEEWTAFLAGIRVGDLVLAPTAGGRVALGEVTSPVLERPKARNRRLRLVREVAWRGELPRRELPDDLRERLDAPGALGQLRVGGAARRLRRILAGRS